MAEGKDTRQRTRYQVINSNLTKLNELTKWLSKDLPVDIKSNTDTVNFALEFLFEFIMNPALEKNQSISQVLNEYQKMGNNLREQPIKSKLATIEDKLDMMLLLGLNDFALDKDIPSEVRVEMISPMRQGGTAYSAYSKLQNIAAEHKKRVVNKNRDGVMK